MNDKENIERVYAIFDRANEKHARIYGDVPHRGRRDSGDAERDESPVSSGPDAEGRRRPPTRSRERATA